MVLSRAETSARWFFRDATLKVFLTASDEERARRRGRYEAAAARTTEAEVPPERRETGEAGRGFEDPADEAVERIALDDAGEPDRRSDGDGDAAGEAPRVAARQPWELKAEIVEDVSRGAGELRPEARGAGGRDRGYDE